MKNIDKTSIQVSGVDASDWPDMVDAYAVYAQWDDGTPLSDTELDSLNDNDSELIQEIAREDLV